MNEILEPYPANVFDDVQPGDGLIHWTTFGSVFYPDIPDAARHSGSWSEFIAWLQNAGSYPEKKVCPLLKLATFGDFREKKSLRNDANVLMVFGIELDFDNNERLPDTSKPPEWAIAELERLNIRATVYPSPSNTPECPKWRVICPLATAIEPGQRRALSARLIGAIGCVTDECSLTLSQIFYYGKTPTNDYRVLVTFNNPDMGLCIDELEFESKPDNTIKKSIVTHAPSFNFDRQVSEYQQPDEQKLITDLRDALTYIDANDYHTWIRIGKDLEHMGRVGYELWDEWSRTSAKYDAKEMGQKWRSFGGSKYTYKGVFDLAVENGWRVKTDGYVTGKALSGIDISGITSQFGKSQSATKPPVDMPWDGMPPPTVERGVTNRGVKFVWWTDPATGERGRYTDDGEWARLPDEDEPIEPLLKPVSIFDIFTNPSPPPAFIWDAYLPRGTVTLFGAHGGTGKSTVGLMLSVCAAMGRPLFDVATTQCKVLFVSLEDGTHIIRHRLSFICRAMNINPELLRDSLHIVDGTAHPELFSCENRNGGDKTASYFALHNMVKTGGYGLVIVDNASDAFGGDEIVRRQVRAFMRTMAEIARLTDCATLLMAHVDKGTSRGNGGSEAYSGSTAWHNSARSRLFMSREKTGLLTLEHQKSNLGKKREPITLEWPDNGLPSLVGNYDTHGMAQQQGCADDKTAIALLRLIAEFESLGQFCAPGVTSHSNVYAVLKSEPGFKTLKLDKDDTKRIVTQCQRAQWLEPTDYLDKYRHTHQKWTVTNEGRAVAGLPPLPEVNDSAATAATAATAGFTATTADSADVAATAATCA